MKKIFFMAAVMITAALGFTACDKKDMDENFDFSHTSWESSIDNDEMSGTLTLTFTDEKNGIVKGDIQGRDGQKYTTYHSFTYEAEMGRGSLHVTRELCIMGKYSSNMFASMDLSFTFDKEAKTLELSNQEGSQTYSSTEYIAISLPVTSTPEAGSPDIKLTRDMMLGTWKNFLELGYDCIFSFEIFSSYYGNISYLGAIHLDCVLGKLRSHWIHITGLDYHIENDNTVVYLDEQNPDKALYKLEFCDANRDGDLIVYTVNMYDADGNMMLTTGLVDQKQVSE